MFGGRKQRQTPDFNRVDTILGAGTEVKGTLKAEGTLRIDGTVEGEIEVNGDLIISESARLTANVKGRSATVAGEIKGDMDLSGRLKLTLPVKYMGRLMWAVWQLAKRLFVGNCSMKDEGTSNRWNSRRKLRSMAILSSVKCPSDG